MDFTRLDPQKASILDEVRGDSIQFDFITNRKLFHKINIILSFFDTSFIVRLLWS